MRLRDRLLPREQTRAALWMAGLAAAITLGWYLWDSLVQLVPDQHGMYALPKGWLPTIAGMLLAAGAGAGLAWAGRRFGAPRAVFGFVALLEAWRIVTTLLTVVYVEILMVTSSGPQGAFLPDFTHSLGAALFIVGMIAFLFGAGGAARDPDTDDDADESRSHEAPPRVVDALGLDKAGGADRALAEWSIVLIIAPALLSFLTLPLLSLLMPQATSAGGGIARAQIMRSVPAVVSLVAAFAVSYFGVRKWRAPGALWIPQAAGLTAGLAAGLVASAPYLASVSRTGLTDASISVAISVANVALPIAGAIAGVMLATRPGGSPTGPSATIGPTPTEEAPQ